jgi:hypothetical protein
MARYGVAAADGDAKFVIASERHRSPANLERTAASASHSSENTHENTPSAQTPNRNGKPSVWFSCPTWGKKDVADLVFIVEIDE